MGYDCTDCQFQRVERGWTECSRDDEECYEWQSLSNPENPCPAYKPKMSMAEYKASEAC
jgi:hypothetical protein